ncbi:hypothetical protein LTR84_007658 [Exophiala bonariae]|uniref:Ataxin-2 C-terminal domain-containing protein n=1 Tax=Exophiala bonariae TaxID=1690606 RepID=A0AAV9NKP0_9EURO|nr:hypothetical protein LTR84_007658 [Exophiala bonariae]
MPETNGISSSHDNDTIAIATSHLGKRKRTVSPEPTTPSEKPRDASLHETLQKVLHVFRKHDTKPSLLKYPLPPSASDSPSVKKARLTESEVTNDTIEQRILTERYHSLDALSEDVNTAKNALLNEFSSVTPNGQVEHVTVPDVDLKMQASNLVTLVLNCLKEPSPSLLPNGGTSSGDAKDLDGPIQSNPRSCQVLSLRTQTHGQTPLLYSGLQNKGEENNHEGDTSSADDGLALPNGFELTDFAALNAVIKPQKLAPRTFGEVFGSHASAHVTPLDEPKPSRNSTRSKELNFLPVAGISKNPSKSKIDYKDAELSIGKWITNRFSNSRNPSLSTTTLHRSEKASQARSADDEEALFRSAYSSFAPTSDNTDAVISSEDMAQYWWRKSGVRKLSTSFSTPDTNGNGKEEITPEIQDFENILENWIPAQNEGFPSTEVKEINDANDLLEEVSELIQTLSSYQRNRSLDGSGRIPEPSEAEFDVFALLRTQLRLLVDALPPFAIAKLNGDQLEELNISTNLLVNAPEYAGTGQLDEYASSRKRISAAAAAAVAPSRPAVPPQVRPSYVPPQASTPTFNVQARSYNASIPAATPYGMRPATNYQTPASARPPYTQTPYQSQTTSYNANRATIQQYQRALSNGVGGYAGTPGQAQTPTLAQRPTQPGYQQRAQDSAMALLGRSGSGSPQKPLMNGQTYTPRGLTQTQYSYQRPNSGTPATPTYAKVAAVRYEGAVDTKNGDLGSTGRGQAPGNSQPQSPAVAAAAAMSQSQTVEVSR